MRSGNTECNKLWKCTVKAVQLCCKVPDIPALSYGIMIFAHHYQRRVQNPSEICLSLLVPLLSWKVFLITCCAHLWQEKADRNPSEFQTLLPSRVIVLCVIFEAFNHLPVIYIFKNTRISFIAGGGELFKICTQNYLKSVTYFWWKHLYVLLEENKTWDSRGYFSYLSRDSVSDHQLMWGGLWTQIWSLKLTEFQIQR